MLETLIALVIALVGMLSGSSVEFDNFDNLIKSAPQCWEDEVIVLVIDDPYGDLDLNNTVGCVPADDLPTTGYRP